MRFRTVPSTMIRSLGLCQAPSVQDLIGLVKKDNRSFVMMESGVVQKYLVSVCLFYLRYKLQYIVYT